jgi:hypothetical protein
LQHDFVPGPLTRNDRRRLSIGCRHSILLQLASTLRNMIATAGKLDAIGGIVNMCRSWLVVRF